MSENIFNQNIPEIDLRDALVEPLTAIDKLELNQNDMKYKCEAYFLNLQGKIIKELEKLEGKRFNIERTLKENGAGLEVVAIIENGQVFERANVHFGLVRGVLPLNAVKIMRKKTNFTTHANFTVVSISSVVHPSNPYVPNFHFNYRYFEVKDPSSDYSEWWFGGVSDLTPYYINERDIQHFHLTLKDACDKYDSSYYSRFKQECDKYFYNVHRKEHRGVGGIFFDDMDTPNQEHVFGLVKSLGDSIVPSYLPIITRNMNKEYTDAQRDWQLVRRGRYVEFNLVYDRGTKFGLKMPNAPVESILMSMPLNSRWTYKRNFELNEDEAKLMNILTNPKEWI